MLTAILLAFCAATALALASWQGYLHGESVITPLWVPLSAALFALATLLLAPTWIIQLPYALLVLCELLVLLTRTRPRAARS